MSCPAVVRITVPSGPAVARVVTPGPVGPQGPMAPTRPILENKTLLSENYTIVTGNNGLSVGPVTIADGVTVTLEWNTEWRVI